MSRQMNSHLLFKVINHVFPTFNNVTIICLLNYLFGPKIFGIKIGIVIGYYQKKKFNSEVPTYLATI